MSAGVIVPHLAVIPKQVNYLGDLVDIFIPKSLYRSEISIIFEPAE